MLVMPAALLWAAAAGGGDAGQCAAGAAGCAAPRRPYGPPAYVAGPQALASAQGGAHYQGRYYWGSVWNGVFSVPENGGEEPRVEIPQPWGPADDVAIRESDGTMVWTDIIQGQVGVRHPNGTMGFVPLLGANPVKFHPKTGRCYVASCYFAAGFYELDLDTLRLDPFPGLAGDMINSFEFHPTDGLVYAPRVSDGAVVRFDVAEKEATAEIAAPPGEHTAGNGQFMYNVGTAIDSDGAIYHLEHNGKGQALVSRLSGSAGAMKGEVVLGLGKILDAAMIDNFEIVGKIMYLTITAPLSIVRVDLTTGDIKMLWEAALPVFAAPGFGMVGDSLFAGYPNRAKLKAVTPGSGRAPGGAAEMVHFTWTPSIVGFGISYVVDSPADGVFYTVGMGPLDPEKGPPVSRYDRAPPHALAGVSWLPLPGTGVSGAASVGAGRLALCELSMAPGGANKIVVVSDVGGTPTREVVVEDPGVPVGIAHKDGVLYWADWDGGRVMRHDFVAGATREVLGGLIRPSAVAAVPAGVAVLEAGRARLLLVTARGVDVLAVGIPVPDLWRGAPALFAPNLHAQVGQSWLAAGSDGTLYVADNVGNGVIALNPN